MRWIAPLFLCGRSFLPSTTTIQGSATRPLAFNRVPFQANILAFSSALLLSASSENTSSSSSSPAAMLGTGYLNAKDAAALDEELMSTPGFSLDQLMELAGLAVAEALYLGVPPFADEESSRKVLFVCGPGNNGGDGLVAARHLSFFGNYDCTIVYPKRSKKQHFINLVKQCEDLSIPVLDEMPPQSEIDAYDAIVDAIFGFSFKGEPREPFGTILRQLKEAQESDNGEQTIFSVDVPSGWNVDEGDVAETGFVPDILISLTAPKLCSKEFQGRHFIGGRFLPPKVGEKYNVRMPPYKGLSQVMEVTREQIEGESPEEPYDPYSSPTWWEQEYQEYCIKAEARLAEKVVDNQDLHSEFHWSKDEQEMQDEAYWNYSRPLTEEEKRRNQWYSYQLSKTQYQSTPEPTWEGDSEKYRHKRAHQNQKEKMKTFEALQEKKKLRDKTKLSQDHMEDKPPKPSANPVSSDDSWMEEYAAYLAKKEKVTQDNTNTAAPSNVNPDPKEANDSPPEPSWEEQYQAYCIEKEARLAEEDARKKEASTSEVASDPTETNESKDSPSEPTWEEQYQAYCIEKEARLAEEDARKREALQKEETSTSEVASDPKETNESKDSPSEPTWEEQYQAYCIEEEARLAKEKVRRKEDSAAEDESNESTSKPDWEDEWDTMRHDAIEKEMEQDERDEEAFQKWKKLNPPDKAQYEANSELNREGQALRALRDHEEDMKAFKAFQKLKKMNQPDET